MTRRRGQIAWWMFALGVGFHANTLQAHELAKDAPVIAPALNLPRTAREPALGLDRLHIDGQARLRLDEGKLLVTAEYELSAAEPGAISLDQTPLILPLLAPIVAGNVLDSGIFPAAGQSLESEAEGVTVVRAAGALQVRGTVRQGQRSSVRVRYLIAYQTPSIRLGIAGRGAQTWLSVSVVAAAPARLRLAADRPAKLSRLEQDRERLVGAGLARPLRAGEVATFVVADLPGPPLAIRKTLLLLVMMMTVGVAGLVWSQRAAAPSDQAASLDGGGA